MSNWFNCSSVSFFSKWYNDSTSNWSTTVAYQGSWNKGTGRVGIMCFTNMAATLKNTTIKQIKLYLKANQTGWGAWNKTNVAFWGAASGYRNSVGAYNGKIYANTLLGSNNAFGWYGGWSNRISNGQSNAPITMSASENSSLFTAMAAYLQSGANNIVVAQPGESGTWVSSSMPHSPNYEAFNAAVIQVEYDKGSARICTNASANTWNVAFPYICTNASANTWQQTIPYICTNASANTWNVCGG